MSKSTVYRTSGLTVSSEAHKPDRPDRKPPRYTFCLKCSTLTEGRATCAECGEPRERPEIVEWPV